MQNHAIRRADLSSRMMDTVYPKQEKRQGLIQRWLRGLGFMQGSSQRGEKSFTEHQISYPWHLSIVPGGHIIAATQGWVKVCHEHLSSRQLLTVVLLSKSFKVMALVLRSNFERRVPFQWKVPYCSFLCFFSRFEKMWTIEIDTGTLTVEPDQGSFSVLGVNSTACFNSR